MSANSPYLFLSMFEQSTYPMLGLILGIPFNGFLFKSAFNPEIPMNKSAFVRVLKQLLIIEMALGTNKSSESTIKK